MREKLQQQNIYSEVAIEENKIKSFHKSNTTCTSFRVYKNGEAGFHRQVGEIEDERGYALAEENLCLHRPYPYSLETGIRSRNKIERNYTDKELLDAAKEALAHLTEKYPQYTLYGSFSMQSSRVSQTNDLGMDFENRDCHMQATFRYKHNTGTNLWDGSFSISERNFSMEKLYDIADNYLGAFENKVELPEEAILQTQYYNFTGYLSGHLDAELLSLNTSLLAGKLGQQVFSEDFTLVDDVSDEYCWHSAFWDGEGCVKENDKRVFIEKGVPLLGYADKRIAEKYNVPHTGNAYHSYSDVPTSGNASMQIKRSTKTVKELLNGRLSIVLDNYSGGGFNEKGDYVMPVHHAFLCDGEKFLGSLPPFTLSSNLFDMFGKDFIGVGSDQPVFNDKQVLFKVNISQNQ